MSSDGHPVLYLRAGRGVPRADINRFARDLGKQLSPDRPVTFLISDDRELRRLNRDFRGADYPTDVLSFSSASPATLGDIAISRDQASAQADEYGHSLGEEIRILMLHGILHLLGYDHDADRGEMRREERRWRRRFGLPESLTERVRR